MTDNLNTSTHTGHRPLRVGLIGVTGYAQAYVEEINKLIDKGWVTWGAVTIINQDVAREQVDYFKKAGVPIYADYRQMYEQEAGQLDWVCIPTAIEWHTPMTLDALRLGYPVLLEKPMAPTLQDVERIQTAERETGLVVGIGYQHFYNSSTLEIKRRLLAGEIGEILRIDGICLWPRARSYYSRNSWGGRLFVNDSWVLDSPMHNAISHIVNLILFFGGLELEQRADPVSVKAELYRAKPIQSFDTVRSEVVLDTGAKASIVFSHSTVDSTDPEIRITGSRGKFIWRFSGDHSFEIDGKVETLGPEDQIHIREAMFENVVRRIRGDATSRICSTEQAKGEVKWVNASHDAALIQDIPELYRQQIDSETGDVFDVVGGLDQVAKQAYHDCCWFRDLDVPWAVDPGILDLTDYTAFLARKIPSPAPRVAGSLS